MEGEGGTEEGREGREGRIEGERERGREIRRYALSITYTPPHTHTHSLDVLTARSNEGGAEDDCQILSRHLVLRFIAANFSEVFQDGIESEAVVGRKAV